MSAAARFVIWWSDARWRLWTIRENIARKVEKTPSWSSLKSIGQSRVVALTILVPFIGHLIIFNDHLNGVLLISSEAARRWFNMAEGEHADQAARALTFVRIQITYFGLALLGLGTFLFTTLCPPEIKANSTVSEYIDIESPLITRARTSLLVRDVARDFLRCHGESQSHGPELLRRMSYTVEQMALFDSVFQEIAQSMDWREEETLGAATNQGESEPVPFRMGLITISGEYRSDKIAEVIDRHLRVEKGFWASFEGAAANFLTDLINLRYLALDNSRPFFRIAVLLFYASGFLILLYPTAWTFFRIAARLLRLS